jgi:elongation factor G
MALRAAVEKAGSVLLEPIMKLEVVVPEENLGDVLNDLNGRRAEVTKMDTLGGAKRLDAMVPLAEMFGYATTVRSLSQGRATFTMEPARYAPVPAETAKEILG